MSEPMIFESTLTNPPRYYISSAYKRRNEHTVEITGKKYDVTEQIEAIISRRMERAQGEVSGGMPWPGDDATNSPSKRSATR
jgi:hypothetical protein